MSVACYEGRIGCPFFLASLFFFFFFLLLFLHSFFHLYSVFVVVVLYSFAIPKPRSEVVAARDKSSTRRGVCDTTNVSVVT